MNSSSITSGTFAEQQLIGDAGPFRIAVAVHAPSTTLAPHYHTCATATVLLGGDYAELLIGQSHQLQAMNMVVKPPGVVHANRIGPRGARSLLIEVNENALANLQEVSTLFETPRILNDTPAASLAPAMVAHLSRRKWLTAFQLDSLLMEWIALADPSCRARARTPTPVWLVRLAEQVAHCPVPELRLQSLARDTGYHPAYVAKAFRLHFGQSIGNYARMLRVARAARALSEARGSVSRIAYDSGYYDHSHLTHEFRSRTGYTPTAWRRIASA